MDNDSDEMKSYTIQCYEKKQKLQASEKQGIIMARISLAKKKK